MASKDGAVEAPKKDPVEPVSAPVDEVEPFEFPDDPVEAVAEATEVDPIAAKELAGAYQEAIYEADQAEKFEEGTSVRVDALEARIATKKDAQEAEKKDAPLNESEALAKQEKEVAERLEAAEKKAEDEDIQKVKVV